MTEAQATSISTALTTAGQTVMADFISVLPAVASIIAVAFVIGFVTYWLKKLRRVK